MGQQSGLRTQVGRSKKANNRLGQVRNVLRGPKHSGHQRLAHGTVRWGDVGV